MDLPNRRHIRAGAWSVVLAAVAALVAFGIAANNGQHLPVWWVGSAAVALFLAVIALPLTYVGQPPKQDGVAPHGVSVDSVDQHAAQGPIYNQFGPGHQIIHNAASPTGKTEEPFADEIQKVFRQQPLAMTGGDGAEWEKQYSFEPVRGLSPSQPMYAKVLTVVNGSDIERRRCRVRIREISPPQTSVVTPVDLEWLGFGATEIDLEPGGEAHVVIARAYQTIQPALDGSRRIYARHWNEPLNDIADDNIIVTVAAWAEGVQPAVERFSVSGFLDPDTSRVYPSVKHVEVSKGRIPVSQAPEVQGLSEIEITQCGDSILTLGSVIRCLAATLAVWTRDLTLQRQLEKAFPEPGDASDWRGDDALSFEGFANRVTRTLVRYKLAEEHRQRVPPTQNAAAAVERISLFVPGARAVDGSFSEFRWTPYGQDIANRLSEESPIKDIGGTSRSPAAAAPSPLAMTTHRWDAFISHAHEDKAAFVVDLAHELTVRGLRIWYDDDVLEVGDSVRAAIDNGLRDSDFGIVIVSRDFMRKDWPKRELDAILALERGQKRLLPVWHDVEQTEVVAYSPVVAGRFALRSTDGVTHVADELLRVIRKAAAAVKTDEPDAIVDKVPDRGRASDHDASQPTSIRSAVARTPPDRRQEESLAGGANRAAMRQRFSDLVPPAVVSVIAAARLIQAAANARSPLTLEQVTILDAPMDLFDLYPETKELAGAVAELRHHAVTYRVQVETLLARSAEMKEAAKLSLRPDLGLVVERLSNAVGDRADLVIGAAVAVRAAASRIVVGGDAHLSG